MLSRMESERCNGADTVTWYGPTRKSGTRVERWGTGWTSRSHCLSRTTGLQSARLYLVPVGR